MALHSLKFTQMGEKLIFCKLIKPNRTIPTRKPRFLTVGSDLAKINGSQIIHNAKLRVFLLNKGAN